MDAKISGDGDSKETKADLETAFLFVEPRVSEAE
jgi:hypothetical protein